MRTIGLQTTIDVYKNIVLNLGGRYVVKQTDWWLQLILFIWFSKLDECLCDCESWALHSSCIHIQHHHVYTVQLVQQFRIRLFLSAWYDSTVLDRIHALFLESLSLISTLLCVYCWKPRNKTKSYSYNISLLQVFSCSCITVWLCVCYISITHLFQHCHQCIYHFFVMLYFLT